MLRNSSLASTTSLVATAAKRWNAAQFFFQPSTIWRWCPEQLGLPATDRSSPTVPIVTNRNFRVKMAILGKMCLMFRSKV
jgi:hypothetical protein